MKIRNRLLAGKEVSLSSEGLRQFDAEGIVEVESEEVYHSLLELNNFEAVEEVPQGNENGEGDQVPQGNEGDKGTSDEGAKGEGVPTPPAGEVVEPKKEEAKAKKPHVHPSSSK